MFDVLLKMFDDFSNVFYDKQIFIDFKMLQTVILCAAKICSVALIHDSVHDLLFSLYFKQNWNEEK